MCKWCKIDSSFLSSNTYALPVLTMGTKHPKQVFYVWLVDLHTICAKQGLETWFFPNNGIRIYLLDIKHSITKNAFWVLNNTKWRKWCKFVLPFLFNYTYGYLRSQQTPNVQIKYFMSYCSIFTPIVLNRGCKRDFLQMMLFVYVCSRCFIFELKTRFETWITGYDVHGVWLFLLSCIITLMAYLCSQWSPNV
jgi:hypothetical protein